MDTNPFPEDHYEDLPVLPRAESIELPDLNEALESGDAPPAERHSPRRVANLPRVRQPDPVSVIAELLQFDCPACGSKLTFSGDTGKCKGGPCPRCAAVIMPPRLMEADSGESQKTEVRRVAPAPVVAPPPPRRLMKVEFMSAREPEVLPY